jgi:hypothetical protein
VLAQVSQLFEVAAVEVDDFATRNSAPRVTDPDHGQGLLASSRPNCNHLGWRQAKNRGGQMPMMHANVAGGAFAAAVGLLLSDTVMAAEWPEDCQEATLPSGDANYPND